MSLVEGLMKRTLKWKTRAGQRQQGWEVMGMDELEALFAELRACPPDQVEVKLAALQLKRRKVGQPSGAGPTGEAHHLDAWRSWQTEW